MTKESETVAPAADRSYIVVVLVALIMISAVGVLFGRRKALKIGSGSGLQMRTRHQTDE
ncbi:MULTISPECIES: hypothetical protein [Rhodococcus]|uniref:hypothetical protein n=1 Tax=Rhodococcus TaxID=1827 RepID=UPI0012B50745|nr:hypothetical protein [Rhodococcus sp. AQ5-07]